MQEREPIDPSEEPHIASGRRVIARVRDDANADDAYFSPGEDDEDVFCSLYLTPRETAIPEHLVSDDILHDVHRDVRVLYAQVFNGICAELEERLGPSPIWVIVDPDVEDRTTVVLCTDVSLLHLHSSKAWGFYWNTEGEMADELGRWYEGAAARLQLERAATHDYGIREGV